jgi:hypothetical protein
MNFLEDQLINAEDTLFHVKNDLDKLIKKLEKNPEAFEIYLTVFKIRQSILDRYSNRETFIPSR